MRNNLWIGSGISMMGEIPILGNPEKGLAKIMRGLFANSEQGFWYDPNDLTTHYQDAAGTIPVTAAAKPVGLMLDKSRGLVLGVEKWIDSSVSLSGASSKIAPNNYRVYTSDGSYSAVQITGALVVGKQYEVNFEVVSIAAVGGGIAFDGAPVQAVNTIGIKRQIITASSSILALKRADAKVTDYTVKNISVKELAGNHAYQTTSAARPILQQTPILGNELLPVFGSFDAGGVGWAAPNGGWSFSGGAAISTGDAAVGLLRYIMPNPAVTSVGKEYEVSIVIRSKGTKGSVGLSFNDGSSFTKKWTLADMVNGGVLSNLARISLNMSLYIMTTDGWDGSIESVSIKEVIGYREDQNYLAFDGVDDRLLTNLPAPLVNATVLRAIPNVGTQVKYNQSLPMLYEDSTNHAGLIAINRALTRSEQLKLMTELDKKAGATSLETLTFKAFDNNQVGFVYDPNDLTTMYQDAAGSTPVTAAGQPVGLMLDKSKGLALGSEKVTNGGFAAGTQGWTLTGNTTVSTTGARLTGVLSESTLTQTLDLEVGKTYKISASITRVSGDLTVTVPTASRFTGNIIFTATSAQTNLQFRCFGNTIPADVTLSNISVRELKGNHAYQATSASRPILRKDAVTGANYLEFDSIDDYLQIDGVALPSPFTTMFAVDDSTGVYSVLLSAGSAGYLNLTPAGLGLSGTSTLLTRKVPKDVVSFKFTIGNLNIKTALGETNGINSNSFTTTATKYIGVYNPSGNVKFSGNIYGIVAITKDLAASEEAGFRQLFNKRLGV